MATDFWDMFNQFIKGQLKVGTGANAVTQKPTLNPFEAAANLQSVYETAKQQSIKTGGNAGGFDALQNPVIKSIAKLVAEGRAKFKKPPNAFGIASNPTDQQAAGPSVQIKPQFQADALQNPVIKSIAKLVAEGRAKNKKQPNAFGTEAAIPREKSFYADPKNYESINQQLGLNLMGKESPVDISSRLNALNISDLVYRIKTNPGESIQDALKRSAKGPDIIPVYKETNKRPGEDLISLTEKAAVVKAAQPKLATPLPYQDSAKEAGVTSGFNGSGLMREDMKMPDLSGIDFSKPLTSEQQNLVRKAMEVARQQQAINTLNMNEAQEEYELAKPQGTQDANEWRDRYLDSMDAVTEGQKQIDKLQNHVNDTQKQSNVYYNTVQENNGAGKTFSQYVKTGHDYSGAMEAYYNEAAQVAAQHGFSLDKDSFLKDKAAITIMVNQPVPGSRQVINDDINNVGHVYIAIDYGNGNIVYRGFHSIDSPNAATVILKQTVPGQEKNDQNEPWNIGESFVVDQDAADRAVAYMNTYDKKNSEYNIVNKNCVNFAVETLEAAGIPSPTTKRKWTPPQDVIENLKSYGILTQPFIEYLKNYEGYSPADIGQDLQNIKYSD